MKNKENLRVLIIDDDEDDFLIISEYIKRIPVSKFIIDWCPKYKEAIDLMLSGSYDIYLVDYRLGAHTGVEFLQVAHDNKCEEPIILLTGKGNINVDIEAMQLGAVDYLLKSEINVDNIERSIRYALDRSYSTKAIKANERKYRALFEQSKDIIFIADEQLDLIDINEAANLTLSFNREELLKMNLIDLIKQPLYKDIVRQNLLSGKEINDLEVLINVNGSNSKSCTITIVIEKENVDNQTRYHGIIHDITNLKKIEKTTLQVEKLAALGRLVRTLAHEVRNPLNNITLSIEQLKEETEKENTELYLDIIHRNSKRISDLISELLYTSKPSDIQLETHVLQNIVDEVISGAVDRLTLKHMKLEIDFAEEELYISSDKEKLIIALFNMVINAIEAMEEHMGVLSIMLFAQDDKAILKITDNGCGINEENISRLFEPYFTQKRNGMGLGLASTLNILQAHNATVEVASELDEGTSFTILFPLAGMN